MKYAVKMFVKWFIFGLSMALLSSVLTNLLGMHLACLVFSGIGLVFGWKFMRPALSSADPKLLGKKKVNDDAN